MLTQNPHVEPDHAFLDTHLSPYAAIKIITTLKTRAQVEMKIHKKEDSMQLEFFSKPHIKSSQTKKFYLTQNVVLMKLYTDWLLCK